MEWISWIAHNWLTLIVVIFSFGFIIFVHELGHFGIAKRVGIRVHEFALGFGPRLFSRRRGETEYCLRAFPFGGFVRMEGEDDPEADPNDPGSFQNKPVLSQIAVVAGGCFMNYLCALIVLLIVGFLHGIPVITKSSVLAKVDVNTPAGMAGLQAGDKVVAINGRPVNSWDDLTREVQPAAGRELQVTVLRNGQDRVFKITPREGTVPGPDGKPQKVGQLGVRTEEAGGFSIQFRNPTGAMDVLGGSGEWIVKITVLPAVIIYKMMSRQVAVGEVAKGTGGPLLIGQMFFEIAHQGIWALLFFWAFICASVGAFNLFPIPALDGSRIVFLAIGAIRGRALDPRKEGMVHMVGLVLLLFVMVCFTIQDVIRIIKGAKFFSIILGSWIGM